jgi:hypothetical protein
MGIIHPNANKFQLLDLQGLDPDDFEVAEDQYFVDVKIWKTYVDPAK